MKENIEKQVIGLFFSMLVILVGVAWLAVNSIQQSKDTSDWVNHTHEVILDADAATSFLHAGDASMYAFVLTGDRRDQENYRRAYGEMVIWLNAARDATRSDAYHKDFLALTNLIGQHINSARSIVQAREQSGEAAARQLLQATPDGSSTADIDRLVSLIKAHQENLLRQRDNEAWKQALNTTHVIEAGVVVNFALLLFASFLIRDDVKARRIAATAMAEANAQLEAKVQERTAELVKSNQFLKKENLERRWSYQALDHQFRYNQLIVNAISEMVFVVSKALNISRVNPAVTHVTQWEAQDLISQSIERVLQIPADGPANPIISALNEGRELQERPAVVLTKPGATIPVRFNLVPLRDENKVVGGVVTVRPWLGPPQPPV
ncbi:MAG TPA: CHASE3 domain-containing protein [Candidatus Acidoferrum sp.]|nr:CHASE3 domain-containing protein [Candidatus Acidoferrum sp.]